MKTLGLDISTKTGLAVVSSDKKVLYTAQIEVGSLKGWERAQFIVASIMEAHTKYKPDLVVIEGYGYANAHTLVTLAEIGTLVRYFLWQEGIKYVEVPPNSLKMFVTGKGTSKKEVILLEVFKQWGVTAQTNDIADAIGLGMFGLALKGVSFSATSMKAVEAVRNGKPAKNRKKPPVECN